MTRLTARWKILWKNFQTIFRGWYAIYKRYDYDQQCFVLQCETGNS